ncbi:MAG: hypothetical protein EA400_09475 [Chromatiaceae bacterium]|nr:MAG: hypothetical protein EA400_09475 [Chromatiaceae bacterium]
MTDSIAPSVAAASSAAPTPPAWAGCLREPARGFDLTPLRLLAGSLPAGLQGTLYRNGPARLGRGGRPVGHWFDGDGAVLAVQFDQGRAMATYRFVETAGYRAETAAGRLLFGNYGMTAPGPIWNHWRRPLKNSANTSVLALPDRLLALWEGGQPHALDLATLATFGSDDLDGTLPAQAPYSAHPKRDPEGGDIYNFGIAIGGPDATLRLYRGDPSGRVQARSELRLTGVPLVHDFVLAGPYLLFLIPPVRIDVLSVFLGLKSYRAAMRWRPELGTQILVFARDSLQLVARGEAPPWYQWHFGNGALVAADELVLDLARYEDFATNAHLAEVANGCTYTPAEARLWRLRLAPASARLLVAEPVSDRSFEFPMVAPAAVGRPWTRTYGVLHRVGTDTTSERYDSLGCHDYASGRLYEADLGPARYPSEPILTGPVADAPDGWLLSVVYNGVDHRSEVWVLDAADLAAGPRAVLALPAVIPLGFHGCWRPAPGT